MIRAPLSLLVFLVVAWFGGLYLGYGHVDPCRALAVERARRSAVPTGVAETWTHLATGRMSKGACAEGLLKSWADRLRENIR